MGTHENMDFSSWYSLPLKLRFELLDGIKNSQVAQVEEQLLIKMCTVCPKRK